MFPLTPSNPARLNLALETRLGSTERASLSALAAISGSAMRHENASLLRESFEISRSIFGSEEPCSELGNRREKSSDDSIAESIELIDLSKMAMRTPMHPADVVLASLKIDAASSHERQRQIGYLAGRFEACSG